MGDSTNETSSERLERQQLLKKLVDGPCLNLDYHLISLISDHVDYFVNRSRGNEKVQEVRLYPYTFRDHDDNVWEKIGRAVGNLRALDSIGLISTRNYHDEDLPIPDWEILTRILRHVQQRITLSASSYHLHFSTWPVEECRSFARAIRGHPTITSFEDNVISPYESLDTLYSALATLPALESIRLSNRGLPVHNTQPEDEFTLVYPENLTKLLRVPSLRSVCFDRYSFTPALCQATANAFMEGTVVTKLEFRECSFSTGECAAIFTTGLSRNTSVLSISFVRQLDVTLIGALVAALSSNSAIRELSFRRCSVKFARLSSVFSAMEKNTALKILKVDVCESMDESLCSTEESLCTAIKDGLRMNETLERLELYNVPLVDDNADSWCRALSFLRTNKALKSLVFEVKHYFTVLPSIIQSSYLSAFRIDIAAMLKENASLENLSILCRCRFTAEEYVALITVLQRNRTLKTVSLDGYSKLWLTDAEEKDVAKILKKNCGLEILSDIDLGNRVGDVGAILRLNAAGRRYLVEDGSSISKGVQVLSSVNDDISCIFLHLSENPRLCDRTAVEARK